MEISKPTLRFPNFNNPWENKKIGDLYQNLRTGMTPYRGKPEYYNGDILWIASGELNYGYIYNTREKITLQAVKDTNLEIYSPNTLFIAITGLEAPGTRGKCAINKLPATTNQSCMAFDEKDGVSTFFLFFWYQKYGIELYYEYAQGTKQQSFNNKIVKRFKISLPDINEQTKIANFLSSVDEKINLLKEKKSLLEDYKKGVMQKIFNQEIRFKDDNGTDFEDWNEKCLGDIGDIITGKTPSTKDSDLWSGDIQFITPTDIKEGVKYQTKTVRYVTKNNKLKILPENSIVYTCIASIGKMCISKFPCITNQQINSLVINKLHDFEYVYYWLLYLTPHIKSTQSNTTLPIINKTDFSKFKIKLPSIKEQTKIANFLSAIDEKIELVSTQIEETQEYKKGLLQQMFV